MFLTHRPQNKTRNAYLVFVLPPKPLTGFISWSEIPARISCANSWLKICMSFYRAKPGLWPVSRTQRELLRPEKVIVCPRNI